MAPTQHPSRFTITPRGRFSLEEAGRFGFGPRLEPTWDGTMRLAFCVDGYRSQVGVEVRQDDTGVHCLVPATAGEVDLDAVRDQVARVLSLDHDGAEFEAVGQRDPVIRRLLEAAPGLRPVLFYSPYEAAAWSVLSARRPAAQMVEVLRTLNAKHGETFILAGRSLAAFPTPQQLLDVSGVDGIDDTKMARLHAVAEAAQGGQLAADRLRSMEPEAALADLQTIPGIGPFYAGLILIRSSGATDVLPTGERRLIDLVTRLYDLPAAPTDAEMAALAEPWRTFRTWVSVLIRAAGRRVLEPVGPT